MLFSAHPKEYRTASACLSYLTGSENHFVALKSFYIFHCTLKAQTVYEQAFKCSFISCLPSWIYQSQRAGLCYIWQSDELCHGLYLSKIWLFYASWISHCRRCLLHWILTLILSAKSPNQWHPSPTVKYHPCLKICFSWGPQTNFAKKSVIA